MGIKSSPILEYDLIKLKYCGVRPLSKKGFIMPEYRYKALNAENKNISGTLLAQSPDELISALRAKKLVLVKYTELSEDKKTAYKLKSNELADFAQEISTMLSSGMSVVHAIDIMMRRDIKEKIRLIYSKLYNDIVNGLTLSEAMEAQKQSFPVLFINMIRTGEESGTLDSVAGKMAVFYTKEHRLNTKIKSATTYPKILLGLIVVVVIVIFTIIMPQFFKLFDGMSLPVPTRIVIAISNFILKYWMFIIVAVPVLILIIKTIINKPVIRLFIDKKKLSFPKIGKLNKIIYTSRFSRTLSSLYSSGLSMMNALNICSTTIGNSYIESQFPKAIEMVRNGEPLSSAIEKIDGFDVKLSLSVLVGQESGQLDKMLDSVADSFDYEAEMATTKLLTYLEPLLIILMAVIVGFIALSVLLPIISLYQNIG